MRTRTLIALLAAVAALGAFIWFFERDLPSTDERRQESKRVLRLEEESVRAIEMGLDESLVRLERRDEPNGAGHPGGGDLDGDETSLGGWIVAVPAKGRADSERIEEFLEELASLETRRTMEDASRQDLGLEGSRTLVRLETDAGEVTLRFGNRVPATTNVIAEVGEGPPFFVVSDALVDDVGRGPNDWRSRDAIPFEEAAIEKIEVLVPDHGVVLERTGERFRIVQPIEDLADRSRASDLLAALADLEVAEFFDRPPALGEGAASARVTFKGVADPLSIAVEANESEPEAAWVRIDEETFKAETNLASLLELAPQQWRSTEWSTLEVFDISAVRVARGGVVEVRFERRDGNWFDSAGSEFDYSLVSTFLRSVGDVTGAPSAPASCPSAGEPEVEIEFETSEAVESLELRSLGNRYCARRVGRDTVLVLESAPVEELLENLGALDRREESDPEADPPQSEDR